MVYIFPKLRLMPGQAHCINISVVSYNNSLISVFEWLLSWAFGRLCLFLSTSHIVQ